ncbi:DUF3857 domain-containing protein [Altererythrobacter aerius]|uniref:DUF3857 domain-containing protein n=1 Tax=Tsuneonella aeria TaxID=1837929 RepID=A0A6I4TCY9_9SPHN|nr:DUF3857 domain-containing protein [Tsuneonella aeria]MXO74923.1 DUF3857 domain-containing protein [Tsuneonella aeria]
MTLLKTTLLAGCALATCAMTSLAMAQETTGGAAVTRGAVPAWVQPSEPLPVPPDASGLAFVRQQDTQVHLEAKGQHSYVGHRIKLLNPQALQIGNLAIAWNPEAGAPILHALKVHRGTETIDLANSARFEVLRREDQLEQSMLSGTLTAIYKVPDLRVGDELELAYSVPSSDPTLKDASAGALMLAGTTMPGRYRLAVSWDQGQEPKLRATDDFSAPARRSANSMTVLVDNPPMIAPPADAPPRYGWQRVIEYSDFPSWESVSKRFAPLFADASRLSAGSPLKAEAARIAAAHPDARGRAQAALELVQEQVRYIYVGLDGGNYRPASAEETWERRYGDCKGKTALLMALLSELGVPARAVLVNASAGDDGLETRLPSPGLFDHVLVHAQIGGKTYWLDGTMPGVIEMREAPALPVRWSLPLTMDGSALVKVAQTPAALPDEMGIYDIDARAGFDKPARMTETMVKRGAEGIAQYLQLSALTSDQMTQAFRNAAAGRGQWETIDAVTYRFDRPTQASVLTITGLGKLDWEDEGDGAYQLVLPGGGFSPPSRRARPAGEDAGVPYYTAPAFSCYATTVRLPDETKLANWGFNSVFDTMMFGRLYYRMMERRDDRTIRLVRGSRVERPETDAATAARDNGRIERFDNSKAVISYDPGEVAEPWGNLHPVPATFETDWTTASASCLPRDVGIQP